MKCKKCGFEGKGDFEFCPKCGTKFEKPKIKPVTKTEKESAKAAKETTGAKFNPQWLFLLAALAVVAVLAFLIFNQGGKNQLLLLVPKTATKSDLVLINLGDKLEKGNRLLKGFTTATKSFITNYDKFPLGSSQITSAASFSADNRSIFATYTEDNDQYLDRFDVKSKEGINLFESGYTINSYIQPGGVDVLIRETRSATSCELLRSVKGEEAKRLLKGKTCLFSTDGSTMMITEDSASTAITLSVAKVSDPDTRIRILDQEKDVLTTNLSSDGTLLYVSVGKLNGAKRVMLYDTAAGKKLVESEPFEYQYATRFSTKGHGFYLVTENEAGIVDLSVWDGQQLVSVKTGKSIHPAFNLDGTMLAYAVSQDQLSQTAFLYDVQAKSEVEITSGKSLSFSFIENPQRLLIRDNVPNEVIIYSADFKGENVVEIFDQAGYAIGSINQPHGQNRLFILTTKNANSYLYTTSLDKEDGFFLVEDFKSIVPLNISKDGNWLVFYGSETTTTATAKKELFKVKIVKGGDMFELEDEGTSYTNAVFTPDGKSLLYTMKTSADRTDSVVKLIEMKDGAKSVELYDQAAIQDISWGRLNPWQLAIWSTQTISGMSNCAESKDLTVSIKRVESTITAGKEECYKVFLAVNQPVSFIATNTSGAAISMSIIDRTGKIYVTGKRTLVSGSNESSTSLVHIPTTTGVFYLKLTSPISTPYVLDVGVRKNSFSNARTIEHGQTVEASLGKEDYFIDRNNLLAYIQGYGQAFSFNGTIGKKITITFTGKTADPNLKPTLGLYSAAKKSLANGVFEDEKNGTLTYTLPSTGRYYLLFLSANLRYGADLTQPFDYSLFVTME